MSTFCFQVPKGQLRLSLSFNIVPYKMCGHRSEFLRRFWDVPFKKSGFESSREVERCKPAWRALSGSPRSAYSFEPAKVGIKSCTSVFWREPPSTINIRPVSFLDGTLSGEGTTKGTLPGCWGRILRRSRVKAHGTFCLLGPNRGIDLYHLLSPRTPSCHMMTILFRRCWFADSAHRVGGGWPTWTSKGA